MSAKFRGEFNVVLRRGQGGGGLHKISIGGLCELRLRVTSPFCVLGGRGGRRSIRRCGLHQHGPCAGPATNRSQKARTDVGDAVDLKAQKRVPVKLVVRRREPRCDTLDARRVPRRGSWRARCRYRAHLDLRTCTPPRRQDRGERRRSAQNCFCPAASGARWARPSGGTETLSMRPPPAATVAFSTVRRVSFEREEGVMVGLHQAECGRLVP